MQKLEAKSLTLEIPSKWKPKYILKRIGEENIYISQLTRDGMLNQLAEGKKYVQIGEFTIMLNAIKSIDPLWQPNNTPPRPKPMFDVQMNGDQATKLQTNQEELKEWEKLFG